MKKLITSITAATFLLLSATVNAAGMWSLIDSQFSGNTWYCTYQLQGTSIQSTITARTFCKSFIYQN